MFVLSTIALIIFFCFVQVDKTDGDSMTLSSGSATVGQPVTLYCAYVGSSTPYTINFYLESDTVGLLILLSSNCSFALPTAYNTTLYDKSCGVKEVSLTIKSVTAADIGKTWYCDATFVIGPSSIAKASTIITAGTTEKPPQSLSDGVIAVIVIVIIIYVTVRVILIELHLMRKNLVGFIFVHICDQVLSNNKRILIASIIPVVGEVILFCNLYKLWKEGGLSTKEWILIIASIILVNGVFILFYLLYKFYCHKERDGTQNHPNRTTSSNRVTPEPNDMEKSPIPNGRGNKLPSIVAETQNLVEAKKRKKKQKKNGENTLEKGSFEKENNV